MLNARYSAPPSGTYYVHMFTSQYPNWNTALDVHTFSGTRTVFGGISLQREWLSRFGRAAASHAVDAVTARLDTPRDAPSYLTLAGRRLSFEAPGTAHPPPWPEHEDGAPERTVSGRDLLMGTSFRAVLGRSPHSQWTGWGRGASVSQFSGSVPALSFTGDLATGSLGMDYERGPLLAGFAMTHSLGAGSAESAVRTWELGSTVTTLAPYARYRLSERVSAWGLAGTGSGAFTLRAAEPVPERHRTDLAMTLAALGLRADLLRPSAPSGLAVAFKADAFWVRTKSDGRASLAMGHLDAARADASRLRVALDGSRTFALPGGRSFAPSLSLGFRHDGGDAETGRGVEVAAGLAYADPARGVDMAFRVYGLAAHADEDYGDWGLSGSLRVAPGAGGRGFSASLAPSWGVVPDSAGTRTFLPDAGVRAAHTASAPVAHLASEVGYGLPMLGGAVTGTPYVGLDLSSAFRDLRAGWRFTPGRVRTGAFALELDVTRRESDADAVPEHTVGARARVTW